MTTPDSDTLAVALEYETGSREAPKVTAKGRGSIADQIIALAQEHGIVVETNEHLAEALSGVELDERIPIELYEAVAEVIGFVLRASGQMKADAS
ncbi:MAG: EscU/YscU/HrcU family type III secretion system export apparatus switch protein [Hyphomicrobiales bacterium]|nr:EscU/YscU/HrcU family type III secretion system export apparatus switch protein [Hyphomicrobiales bacterium]